MLLLKSGRFLTGFTLVVFVVDISVGLHLELAKGPVNEGQDSNELHNGITGFVETENVKDALYDFEGHDEIGGDNLTAEEIFKEEWNKYDQLMEISLIGKLDPAKLNEDCNILPVAPENSTGMCFHSVSIAKCEVTCHELFIFPDNTIQKHFFCLDGIWRPDKLPDCVPASAAVYPKFHHEELPASIDRERFYEIWWNSGKKKLSEIGNIDPKVMSEEFASHKMDYLEISPFNQQYKRDVQRGFDKSTGCNRLPTAPKNAMGSCSHSADIAKCSVACHKFKIYPDNTRMKTFYCLDGEWNPKKLPNCLLEVPIIKCEAAYISGKNMNVSCIEDEETKNCFATCYNGFTFQDKESVKTIKCEKAIRDKVSHIKFPDCYPD